MMQPDRGSLFLIAGPCVIESADLCLHVARHVKSICDRLDIPYVFKASFDKANRSSAASFRGPGIHDGLAVLRRIKEEVGVPVLTDVHEPEQAAEVAKVADILQVPAFLARQTDLLVACAKTGRSVNVKKGQFMSPQEMQNVVEKLRSAGQAAQVSDPGTRAPESGTRLPPIMLTERGTFFGYNRLVNDFTALAVMKSFDVPVVFDATHSTQQPGGLGNASGGNPHYTPLLARAAVAAGVDGLFIECHPEPPKARSDAASVIPLEWMDRLIPELHSIAALRKDWM